MSALNLRARWVDTDADGDLFGAEHVDPRGNAWTICDGCGHRVEADALRCAGLTLEDRALDLQRTHAAALDAPRPWDSLTEPERAAWRMVALSALHRSAFVE